MSKKEITYRGAMEELKDILDDLQSERIDVDEVSVKVKRAVDLIQVCRAKIEKTELDVQKIVKEFNSDFSSNDA